MIYLGFPIGSSRSVGSSEYLSATTGTIREQTGQMNIAIVGTGVSGLVCAHLLSRAHDVTVFEADARPGGHAHTVTVELRDGSFDVDTGFLVYNERNYPGLIRLFDDLGCRPSRAT